MEVPDVQNDILIDKLLRKAELFIPNVVLYFERDPFLLRNNNFEINHSAKNDETEKQDLSPHFDPFDLTPMRKIRAGTEISNFNFTLRDFQLTYAKGWFLHISSSKEKDTKDKNDHNNYWLMFMNGQFYFYYQNEKTVSYSKSKGQLSLKGKSLCYINEDRSAIILNVQQNPKFEDYANFINNCIQNKSNQPHETFIKSFKATQGYPRVDEQTLGFYQFYFQNPSFLLILGTTTKTENSEKELIDVFIKACNDKIFSIFRVFMFYLFKSKKWTSAFDQNYLLFEAIRTICSESPEYNQTRERLASCEQSEYDHLEYNDVGAFGSYIMMLIYQCLHLADYNEDSELITAFVMFYLKVLMDIKVTASKDETFITDENIIFARMYAEQIMEYSMILKEPLSTSDVTIIINEINKNIDQYITSFTTSTVSNQIDKLNALLNPAQAIKSSKSPSQNDILKHRPTAKFNSLKIGSVGSLTSIPKVPPNMMSGPGSLSRRSRGHLKIPAPQRPSSDEFELTPNEDGDIDPHLYDSFPANIPPPQPKQEASSFLLSEDDTEKDSILFSTESSFTPTSMESITPVLEETTESDKKEETDKKEENAKTEENDKTTEENDKTTEVDKKEVPKELTEKEKKREEKRQKKIEEKKQKKREERERRKEEHQKRKEEKMRKKAEKEKLQEVEKEIKETENDKENEADSSDASSLSSTLSDTDYSDVSSLSSTLSEEEEKAENVLKAAPNYDGTEEPPLEERDESDTTIQDDAV